MAAKPDDRTTSRLGVIGLGVMGSNLALNVEEHGFPVTVWNRDPEKTRRFLSRHRGKRFGGAETLDEFVARVGRPRRILIMIQAGEPVDLMIDHLGPLLEEGDILIDGGNSWFEDTRRRATELAEEGLHFFGLGVSGGQEGARFGPSLMPGGDPGAYKHLQPILEAVAARSDSGPCVAWLGPDGAGHFVKMVHNGIEYGDMQLIAEAYDLLRRVGGLRTEEIAGVFAEWNLGPLESFLIELAAKVLTVRDEETGRPLVDLVLDRAGQKGTGGWTLNAAVDLGVPVPTISAAVDARALSAMKAERVEAAGVIQASTTLPSGIGPGELIASVHDSLLAARICTYAQGMSLIRAASLRYAWEVRMREIARIWKAGCIIRARLLDPVMQAYERRPDLMNLLVDDELRRQVRSAEAAWRRTAALAQGAGIPIPAMASGLAYFDGYRTADLPQNLTQAQRDAFGSHMYRRADRPDRDPVHTEWLKLAGKGRAKKRARASARRRSRRDS